MQQDRHGAGPGERRAGDEDARRVVQGGERLGHSPMLGALHVRRVKRDLDRLREPFDLVVIGAGIYGAAIAWDATLRGLRWP